MSSKALTESQLPSAQNPLALENQVCFSLYSATNAMIRAYRPL
ncbi:MAG TPA: MarR family transcriptional regulator, partial [Shewanella frigidimarina]|nr:MarR family transcriptional regulator [Shewanella frigidimarina]